MSDRLIVIDVRVLKDKVEALSQALFRNLVDVLASNQDLTRADLSEPKENLKNTGLASASSSHHSNFLAVVDLKVHVLNRWLQVLLIFHLSVLEFDVTKRLEVWQLLVLFFWLQIDVLK